METITAYFSLKKSSDREDNNSFFSFKENFPQSSISPFYCRVLSQNLKSSPCLCSFCASIMSFVSLSLWSILTLGGYLSSFPSPHLFPLLLSSSRHMHTIKSGPFVCVFCFACYRLSAAFLKRLNRNSFYGGNPITAFPGSHA